MDSVSADVNFSSSIPPVEDNAESVHSTNSMENDRVIIVCENNRNGDSAQNLANNSATSSDYLEPVSRLVLSHTQTRENPLNIPRNYDALRSERVRIESFYQSPGWSVPFISPDVCARAGFFFLQDGDYVQCAFCLGVAGKWEQGDDPMAEHRRHFPTCPFICGQPVGNVMADQDESDILTSQEEAAGVDMCGPRAPTNSKLSFSTDKVSMSCVQPLGYDENELVNSLGIKTIGNGPTHTTLVTGQSLFTLHGRVNTFKNWPLETGQTPETMASAGFFYTGSRDIVECFYCHVDLDGWQPSDDPWVKHARHFTGCNYLILNKGDEFIKEATKANPLVRSGQRTGHIVYSKQLFPICPKYVGPIKGSNLCVPPGRALDQDFLGLVDSPVVQAALEVGLNLESVKKALKSKIRLTGRPFLSAEGLVEAVLGLDSDYDSYSDTEADENVEDGNISTTLVPTTDHRPEMNTSSGLNGSGSRGGGVAGRSTETTARLSKNISGEEGNETTYLTDAGTSNSNSNTTQSDMSRDDRFHAKGGNCEEESKEPHAMACVKDKGVEFEKEMLKLRDQTLCKVCMDDQVGIVFLPCGHLVSCIRCATVLSICVLCRQHIKAVVRTYLS